MTSLASPGAADEPAFTAAALARALAAPARRAVVASCVLGAATVAEVAAMTGLPVRDLDDALRKLDTAGLVVWNGATGHVALVEAAFTMAARATAADAPPPPADDTERVLRSYVRDGRLTQIPMQRTKRLVVLDVLAQEFEVGRRYSEAQVNLILGRWHADTAALRRYLVDEGFMDRADRVYWRSGGTVQVTRGTA
jgi:hypothetical protein